MEEGYWFKQFPDQRLLRGGGLLKRRLIEKKTNPVEWWPQCQPLIFFQLLSGFKKYNFVQYWERVWDLLEGMSNWDLMFNMDGGDINPLHLDIRVYILHTVLYMHPKVLKKRICVTIKSISCCLSFPLLSWPQCVIQGWYCKEKLDASHFKGQRFRGCIQERGGL